jgi:hypothetical protein
MSGPGGSASLLSDRQVDLIATRLAERLSGRPAESSENTRANVPAPRITAAPVTPAVAPRKAPEEKPGEGWTTR